jgi:RNA polymerase sigma-70 factor (ECF subfamily)
VAAFDGSGIGWRITDALRAACHPRPIPAASVGAVLFEGLLAPAWASDAVPLDVAPGTVGVDATDRIDADALVVSLFRAEGAALVRLARLFVDDRNAAEDLVQEAFIRLARAARRIEDPAKAPAYLRSIVLNLARDHNRRGLVSLRHHLPLDDARASTEDQIVLRDDQQAVIDALRELPHRQRDCLVLRYYEDLGIDGIAATLGISRNSVKTHLKRGLLSMSRLLDAPYEASDEEALDS